MTDINPKGEYINSWEKCDIKNPNFCCRSCDSKFIKYRDWESSCGGYDDTEYVCEECGYSWLVVKVSDS